MTITREDVADLREGDVVNILRVDHPGVSLQGPLREDGGRLWLGYMPFRTDCGYPSAALDDCTLTVISRGPRPIHDCPDCTHVAVPDQPTADPLAHITEGDPTPEGADADEPCGATNRWGFWGWVCTREPGHPGRHIAGSAVGYSVLAVWS